jgi:hypothetical protein
MFGLTLKNSGKNKMVYSTSLGFRIVFIGIALLISLTFINVSNGLSFQHTSAFALVLFFACLVAALFLERWVFDKDSNLLEKHVGLVFLFGTKKADLQSLTTVVLDRFWKNSEAKTKAGRMLSRRPVALYLKDREGEVYKLDITRGFGIEELRRTAQRLSEFCDIPLEDNSKDSDSEEETPREGLF